jgi:hypothetical protein
MEYSKQELEVRNSYERGREAYLYRFNRRRLLADDARPNGDRPRVPAWRAYLCGSRRGSWELCFGKPRDSMESVRGAMATWSVVTLVSAAVLTSCQVIMAGSVLQGIG